MAILDRITRAASRLSGGGAGVVPKPNEATARQVYEMLEAYYYSNGVYDALVDVARADVEWAKSMLELRNPTYAVVEFYAKKLWPGTLPDALPIEVGENANKAIVPAIHQIWKASNWGAKKTVAARFAAEYGDLFLRVATRKREDGTVKSVYLQLVNPKLVTDFTRDERGVVTWLRYDVKRLRSKPGERPQAYWHTEVWTPVEYRRWESAKGPEDSIESLGAPAETVMLAEMNIDFVPWVHAPFIDTADTESGDQRGMAAIWPAISKIDHLHLSVARLGRMLFRHGRPTWSLTANATDGQQRPLPAPKLDDTVIDLNGEKVYRLPGMSKLEFLVPNVNYAAHAEFCADLYENLKTDLPELRYYEAMQTSSESGLALQYKLGPAVDRVLEVRGVLESALIRAQMMALHIGKEAGLFPNIGSYENGDFEHTFKERDVFPVTDKDRATVVQMYTGAGMPVSTAMREFAGWDNTQIAQMLDDLNAESAVTDVPKPGALPAGVSEAARVTAVSKARDAIAGKSEATIAGALDVGGNIPAAAVADIMERNAGKAVRA